MSSIESKLTSALLRVIRARREEPEAGPVVQAAAPSRGKIREATFADFDGVNELRRKWGLGPDSLENWERLWKNNPALTLMPQKPPMGWVLEAEGRQVGYLGNIATLYHYGDRALVAATGTGLVAEPAYRAASVSLVAAYYKQKVDLYLTTTAIEAVGKIAQAFKSLPLPQAEYDSMLFWVLQPQSFANVVMKKLELKPALSRMGSMLASFAFGTDTILRRRWPARGSTTLEVKEISVEEIGDDFEILWAQKLKEPARLIADRSPAVLRWHFKVPSDTGSARVFCCYKNSELIGYSIIRHESPTRGSGLRRSIIADMLAKDDDPAVLASLWRAAYDQAKEVGSDVFEILGFPPGIRQICQQWHPYLRKYPSCPFYFKAADRNLHNTLSDGKAWYASPFDGDTTLWSFGAAS